MAQAISEQAVLRMTANLAVSPAPEKKPRYKNIMHLWEFLLELLADESYRSLITWSRKAHGEFKLKNQEEVAKRWGQLKRRDGMNYEKLSRALRHYYSAGIIKKVEGQRLVYKFHKLPYEYTPGKGTRLQSGKEKLPATTNTVRRDQYCNVTSPYSRNLPGKEMVRIKLLKESRTNGEEKQTNPTDQFIQERGNSSAAATPESSPLPLQPRCGPLMYSIPVHLPAHTYTCNRCEFGVVGDQNISHHGSHVMFPIPQMYSQFKAFPPAFAPVSVIRRL